jgi:Flp pilus assembly pilin Flp
MLNNPRAKSKKRKGAALVEYALLIAGVALICAAAVSVFGHKTNDLIAATAGVIPGAHADDNAPIQSGHLMETAPNANGAIALDIPTIIGANNTPRLGANMGVTGEGFGGLVLEP